jgi:hypothetical protein
MVVEPKLPLLAPSYRTGTDREGQQRVGYDPLAKPTMDDRSLRIAAVQCDFSVRQVSPQTGGRHSGVDLRFRKTSADLTSVAPSTVCGGVRIATDDVFSPLPFPTDAPPFAAQPRARVGQIKRLFEPSL